MKRTNKGIFVLGTIFFLCACNEKPSFVSSSYNDNIDIALHEHDWSNWELINDPTCIEKGARERTCLICGEKQYADIDVDDVYGHSYIVKSTTATCTDEGVNEMQCALCGYVKPDKEVQNPLGHKWVEDDTYIGVTATCTGSGTARRKCTRCNDTQIYEVNPLGHDYSIEYGAKTDTYVHTGGEVCNYCTTCKRKGCGKKLHYWYADEVTTSCRNENRLVSTNNGVEEYEPNYVVNNGAVRFWGRAIHNAQILDGPPEVITPVYDANVIGSFLEYEVKLEEALNGYYLVAEVAPQDMPTGDQINFFKALEDDWTPGLIDSNLHKYEYRYILSIDDVEIPFTEDSSNAEVDGWVRFPTYNFNLKEGTHKIKITMSGGGLASFYKFGFEKANLVA